MQQNINIYPRPNSENQSCDEALESLIRSIKLNENSLQMGTETYEKLKYQGDQIKRVVDGCVRIDQMVSKAEDLVGKMKSPTGTGFWHHIKKAFAGPIRTKSAREKTEATLQKEMKSAQFKDKAGQESNTSQPNPQVRKDEIDVALDIVEMQILRIKELGLQMGQELDCQNALFGVANTAAEVTVVNVKNVLQDVRGVK